MTQMKGVLGFSGYATTPVLENGDLTWTAAVGASRDDTILRPVSIPFSPDGGMRLLAGNLGRAVITTSAVDTSRLTIEAPVAVFYDQDDVLRAFHAGELDHDVIIVVRFQGPRANGMPELHKLTPSLGVLQDKGYRAALVTDGRMSGASGKVPAAIHVTPEAQVGGPNARLRVGDLIRICAKNSELVVLLEEADWLAREPSACRTALAGSGRELFALMRNGSDGAETGASAMLCRSLTNLGTVESPETSSPGRGPPRG